MGSVYDRDLGARCPTSDLGPYHLGDTTKVTNFSVRLAQDGTTWSVREPPLTFEHNKDINKKNAGSRHGQGNVGCGLVQDQAHKDAHQPPWWCC